MGKVWLSVMVAPFREMMRAIITSFAAATLAGIGTVSADAQEWALNGNASHFYMQTVKADAIFETHRFTGLEGTVGRNGDANVKIDLTSVRSGIDVRDVRMRYLLFETYKFPNAEIAAKLDMNAMRVLDRQSRITYPLRFRLSLHGFSRDMEAPVTITRLSDRSVSVESVRPILVEPEPYGLVAGLAKLSDAINGTVIAQGATFTFDLVFETGDQVAAIEAAREESARRKTEEETGKISAEACETRFSVISTAGAIYFKTGSADLDQASGPMLRSVADIANRCPEVKVQVTGHTDTVGTRDANRVLSEQRARAVLDFLVQYGVARARVDAAGFGDTRPVAPNDTEPHRAKNRRIEFKVVTR